MKNKIISLFFLFFFCGVFAANAQTVIGKGQSAAIGCVQAPSTQTLIAVQPMSASTTFTISCNNFGVNNNFNLLTNQTIKLGCTVTPPNIIGNSDTLVIVQSGQSVTVNCTGTPQPTPSPFPSPVVVGPYPYNQFNSTNPNGNTMNNTFAINNNTNHNIPEDIEVWDPIKSGASIALETVGLGDLGPFTFWDTFKYNAGAYFAIGVSSTDHTTNTGITCDSIDDQYIYSGFCYTFGFGAGSLGFIVPQGLLGAPNIENATRNGPPNFPFGSQTTKLASAPATAPGAGLCNQFVVAGTNPGTCKFQMQCGTSATPVTIMDNIGSGC